MSEQRFYDIVASELQSRSLKPGLWARAVAEVGDEGAGARARYIQLRVTELAEQERLDEEQRREAQRRQMEARRQADFSRTTNSPSCGRCADFSLPDAHDLWKGYCKHHATPTYTNCSCKDFRAA